MLQKLINILDEYGFEKKEIDDLLDSFTVKNVKKNESILEMGDTRKEGYFIAYGGFLLKKWDKTLEDEKTVNIFIDSHIPYMADTNSFLGNKTSDCRIMAFTDSQIGVLKKVDFERLKVKYTRVINFHELRLTEALMLEHNFRTKLLTYSKQDFYNYLANEFPDIIRYVPAKYIAEFMGISPEWLSKLKSKGI